MDHSFYMIETYTVLYYIQRLQSKINDLDWFWMLSTLIAKENANVWFHLYYFLNQQNAMQSQPGNPFYKLPFGSHGSSSTLPKFNMEPKNNGFQKESPIPGYHFQVACWTLEGYHPKNLLPICVPSSVGVMPTKFSGKNKLTSFSPLKTSPKNRWVFFQIGIHLHPGHPKLHQRPTPKRSGTWFPPFPPMDDGFRNFMETGHGFPQKNTDNYARVYHKIVMKYI